MKLVAIQDFDSCVLGLVGSNPTFPAVKSILYSYTPEELQNLLDTSNGYSDVLRKVGLNPKGRNPETLKKIIAKYELDEEQMNINRKALYSKCAILTHVKVSAKLEDIIFNNKYPNYSSSKLLKRLVDEGYKKYKCEICGISEWNKMSISLQLHHKNGNHNDNNLDNLQILCPNCHSQTDSYSGKSSRKNVPLE